MVFSFFLFIIKLFILFDDDYTHTHTLPTLVTAIFLIVLLAKVVEEPADNTPSGATLSSNKL